MVTLVGARGADRIAHSGSVQWGVPDVILYLSRASPTQPFRQMLVEINLLQQLDSPGSLQKCDVTG